MRIITNKSNCSNLCIPKPPRLHLGTPQIESYLESLYLTLDRYNLILDRYKFTSVPL